ncbi:MAG: 2-oxo acid dehydrogenase subunit E2, partial [Acidimicrobiia bacterium]
MSDSRTTETDVAEFGSNVWLVDEMYQRFLDDPESVSEAWREFFDDYRPHLPPGPPTSRPAAGRDLPPLRGGQTGTQAAAGRDLPPLRVGQTGAQPAAGRDLPLAPTGVGGPPTPPPSAVGAPSPSLRLDKGAEALKGIPAAIARRMDESLAVPTATSVRTIPAKLLEVNRRIVNNQLARLTTGGKVSFTHLIGWAIVRALGDLPDLNVAYAEIDGAPHVVRHPHVNLGLAVDVERPDGSRVLLVPNIREADTLDFERFWLAYEDLIRKSRTNRLVPDDFAETTVTLTNPGTIGTVQSVPRLMPDQGVIVGVGAIQYPPEFQAADARYLARQGIGRVVTLTSTYDHRVIQGAQSGELLARIHALLLGEDGFYDEVFDALGVPYTPARWAVDDNPPIGSAEWAEKQANVFRIINAYRVRGHLIADLDPLRQQRPTLYAELDPLFYGLTIWDLDREFATGGLAGTATMELGDILARLRDAYCRTTGVEFMHIQETEQKQWLQERLEIPRVEVTRDERLRILRKLNQAEAFEKFLHTKYVGHKRFGLEGSESMIPLLDALLGAAAGDGIEEVVFGMAHRGRLNVLANVMGKSFSKIFREFEGDLVAEVVLHVARAAGGLDNQVALELPEDLREALSHHIRQHVEPPP